MRKFLLLFVLLSACGSNDNYIDPILEPYVIEFEEYMGVVVDFDVTIKSVGKKHIEARCNKWPVRGVYIGEYVINSATEERNYDKWLRPVVFHELGHCILKLKHDDNLREDGFIASWMYPDSRIIQDWPDEYVNYYKQEMKEKWENK